MSIYGGYMRCFPKRLQEFYQFIIVLFTSKIDSFKMALLSYAFMATFFADRHIHT